MLEANQFIFPAPTKYDLSLIKSHLLFVPKNITQNNILSQRKNKRTISKIANPSNYKVIHPVSHYNDFIPCLYLQGERKEKIMVYFHGNAQDITKAYSFVKHINDNFKHPIISVEYPGYSIYPGTTNSKQIQSDSLQVIKYCQFLGYDLQNIIVVGRSIGSGPAFHIASSMKLGALIVLSPFISVQKVVNDLYGSIIGMLVEQRFNNLEKCIKIETPCLLIHGKQDKMIGYEHSICLAQSIRSYCQLKVIQNMSHCRFDFDFDFILHGRNFLKRVFKQ